LARRTEFIFTAPGRYHFHSMKTMALAAACAFGAGCTFELDVSSITTPMADAPPEAITMCAANQPQCIGRLRVVCNATGTGIDGELSSLCPLACLEGGQCVAASNLPDDAQRACTAAAPVFAPPSNATVQFRPGGGSGGVDLQCSPSCGANAGASISSTRVSQASGPPIALFCLRGIDLPANVNITYDPAVTNALALLVVGNVQIAGKLLLDGGTAGQTVAGQGAPAGGDGGGIAADDSSGAPGGGPCSGSAGSGGTTVGTNASAAGGGGGGGGHAAKGGDGGQGRADTNLGAGGGGGNSCGTSALAQLVGGGGGGAGGDGSCHPSECGWAGGGGGGAIQISATGSLTLTNVAAIRAAGGAGFGLTTGESGRGGGGGGGAGGGILLEAATVNIAGVVDVTGGNGGLSNAGAGGLGATQLLTGGPGAIQNAQDEGGAGGGGASGRIRINAPAASCGATVQPAQACTTGSLRAVP
jgi:hypothetical protein